LERSIKQRECRGGREADNQPKPADFRSRQILLKNSLAQEAMKY